MGEVKMTLITQVLTVSLLQMVTAKHFIVETVDNITSQEYDDNMAKTLNQMKEMDEIIYQTLENNKFELDLYEKLPQKEKDKVRQTIRTADEKNVLKPFLKSLPRFIKGVIVESAGDAGTEAVKEAAESLRRKSKKSLDDEETEILENLDEETAEYYSILPQEIRNDLQETLDALIQSEKNDKKAGEDYSTMWWLPIAGVLINGAIAG